MFWLHSGVPSVPLEVESQRQKSSLDPQSNFDPMGVRQEGTRESWWKRRAEWINVAQKPADLQSRLLSSQVDPTRTGMEPKRIKLSSCAL